jgi:hypothetical protein
MEGIDSKSTRTGEYAIVQSEQHCEGQAYLFILEPKSERQWLFELDLTVLSDSSRE